MISDDWKNVFFTDVKKHGRDHGLAGKSSPTIDFPMTIMTIMGGFWQNFSLKPIQLFMWLLSGYQTCQWTFISIHFHGFPSHLHDFRMSVQVKQDDIFMISAVARLWEY